jgi:tRNA (mo5U34)-methyltransferase
VSLVGSAPEASGELRAQVDGREWYHTIELAPGVVTPGWFDHRPIVPRLPIPADLSARRCLDIGTFDGFWAFEMERRGGLVTAVDILDDRRWDWPANTNPADRDAIERRKGAGGGFLIARAALDARVERLDCSIYDLEPDTHGQFDFVYLGSLLLHLRDPVLALERVRSVLRGQLLIVDAIAPALTLLAPRSPVLSLHGDGRPYWFKPNLAALGRMGEAAGFKVLAGPRPLLMPPGAGFHYPSGAWRTLFTRWGREALLTARLGDPHAWLLLGP